MSNKYEDLARNAVAASAAARIKRDADNARARELAVEQKEKNQEAFNRLVWPELVEAQRGISAGQIPARLTPGSSFGLDLEQTLTIGHDNVRPAAAKRATVSVSMLGRSFFLKVTSANGPDWERQADEKTVTSLLHEAITDAVNRWTEQGGYPKRR